MSNLNNIAEASSIRTRLAYEEKITGEGFGALIISGLIFPENNVFDPLAKIWSSARKRIYERYGIDATGIFFYEPTHGIVNCSFCLNYVTIKSEDEACLYRDKFKDTFKYQMLLFEEVLDAFMLDFEYGYYPYCEYVESHQNEKEERTAEFCHQLFNTFLINQGIKTDKDEVEKSKRQKKLEDLKK